MKTLVKTESVTGAVRTVSNSRVCWNSLCAHGSARDGGVLLPPRYQRAVFVVNNVGMSSSSSLLIEHVLVNSVPFFFCKVNSKAVERSLQ